RRLQGLTVEHHARQIGIEIANDLDLLLLRLRLIERQHAFDLIVQTTSAQVQSAQPGELEKVVEQTFEPRALLLHDLDLGERPAFARRLRLVEILGQQLHVHANHREWVFDLVRQRASQLGQFLQRQPQVLSNAIRSVERFDHTMTFYSGVGGKCRDLTIGMAERQRSPRRHGEHGEDKEERKIKTADERKYTQINQRTLLLFLV